MHHRNRDPTAREKAVARRGARYARAEKPQTLRDLWGVYARDHLPTKRASTAAYHTWLWNKRPLNPRLGHYLISELDRASVRLAMREIGGAHSAGEQDFSLLRRVLNLAVADELDYRYRRWPILRRPFEETSRETEVLCDAELKRLWRALECAPASPTTAVSARMCGALKLALLTGARAGDIAGLRAEEIDIAARCWVIPAQRFKGKRAHTIPLSDAAWATIGAAFGTAPEHWLGPASPTLATPACLCAAPV